MPEYMTPEQLKDYVQNMPDDEILQVIFDAEEDGNERGERDRQV